MQWYDYYFLCCFEHSVSIHSPTGFAFQALVMYQHVCMFWFRMSNIHDNRQASKDERFSKTGREINKDIIASKKLSQIPVVREDCQIVRLLFTAFRDCHHVHFVYLVFIESIIMVPRDPLVQSRVRCTKEQPHARANQNLLQKTLVTCLGRTTFWSLICRRTILGFSSSATQATRSL